MKKHDEGYVLAYVTVVLLVFCLVATTILTGAMKNLEHQQQAQAKMEDKYFAKGMIEQIIAQLDKKGDIFIDCNLFKQIAEDETVIAQVTATVEDGVLTLTAQKGNAAYKVTGQQFVSDLATLLQAHGGIKTISKTSTWNFH